MTNHSEINDHLLLGQMSLSNKNICRAVKVNFGTMEPKDWQPTLLNFILLSAGYNVNTDEAKTTNRHNTYMNDAWYRRKFALVQNYLKIYG
jgi:hypothetical protein